MENKGRCAATGRNMRAALLSHIIITAVNLLTRKFFISAVGSEYIGLSSLIGHALGFLALLECGFSAACAFALYSPLARDERQEISSIIVYLKGKYRIFCALTLIIGTLATPLVVYFAKGQKGAALLWIISVIDQGVSFLFSYRRILPVSDQKSYSVTAASTVFFAAAQTARFAALKICRSFLLYFVIGILFGIAEELYIFLRVGKMYPYLAKKAPVLSREKRHEISVQVKALLFQKIGGVCLGSVDNLAIFAYLGLSCGTLYSNYTMIMGIFLAFVAILTGSVGASVGNLGVMESSARMEKVFLTSYFAVFFVGSTLSITLFFTYPIIMELWMGKDMVQGALPTALFCTSMFISCIKRPVGVFLDGFGLFEKEKYKALLEAGLSLAVTLFLTGKMGISGVLIGQISGLLFSALFEPYILYRYGFLTSSTGFIKENVMYFSALAASVLLSKLLCFRTPGVSVSCALLRAAFCILSCTSVFGLAFFDSERLSAVLKYGRRIVFGR